MFVSASSLTLLSIWVVLSMQALAASCGDGFGPAGDAQVCFSRHPILAASTYNPTKIGGTLVIKPMEPNERVIGLVDTQIGEPCAIRFTPAAWRQNVVDGIPNNTILRWFGSVSNLLQERGKSDCFIDVQDHTAALLHFIGSSSGYLLNQSGTASGIRRIATIEWPGPTRGVDDFSLTILRTGLALPGDHALQLLTAMGIASRRDTEFFVSVPFTTGNGGTYRIARPEELSGRYPNPRSPLKDWLLLSTEQLAAACISSKASEVIAYVISR